MHNKNARFLGSKLGFARTRNISKAVVCRDYLQKGSQVCVEGNVKASAFIGKDGKAQASLNINASEVQFLNRTKHREGGRGIRFNLFVQSLAQSEKKYGRGNATTIKGQLHISNNFF